MAHLPPPAAPWTLSLSPELFLAVDGDTATTRPMKGTAPADTDPAALRSGGKDRAENLMIVDLLRNDLSRVAVPGSVAVPSLFDVERVGNLWQMTSTVTARLTPATTPAGLLAATFPCGSITGAPKLASMRLIRDLEPDRRGIYTGSLGVIEPADTPLGWRMRLSVAIRTLEIHGDGAARLGIGCGVVADSTAGAEWLECLAKAGFATGVGPGVELLETMAVINGVCALGPRHSERLAHSAAALGIPAAPDAVTAAVAGTPRAPGGCRSGSAPTASPPSRAARCPTRPDRCARCLPPPPGRGIHLRGTRRATAPISTPPSDLPRRARST
nr:chorismate-binding protein [Tessaracoccus coleopterorum]